MPDSKMSRARVFLNPSLALSGPQQARQAQFELGLVPLLPSAEKPS